jgi:hypothetical protein
MISDCPNQPNLPRQLKTHIAFSMFPILDTNLWMAAYDHFIEAKKGHKKRYCIGSVEIFFLYIWEKMIQSELLVRHHTS